MGKKKVILIIVLVALLLFGGIGAGFYVMWTKLSDLKSDAGPTSEEASEEAAEADAISQMGPIFPLDTFVVNLADSDRSYYLKITLSLELTSEEMKGELEKRLPKIRDLILTQLPTKKSEDLKTVAGKQALREELMAGINERLQTAEVRNIYFTDFVIQ